MAEAELEALCREHRVDCVMFAYSDVSHAEVMHLGSRALARGAGFWLPGPDETMLESSRPVIAVSAVRTGCGKSQVARYLSGRLRERGLRVAVLRHPMPYGDLARQQVQRFASGADIDAGDCTVEEREEYEPHVAAGNLVFAGVDYRAILAAAEAEADVVLWDGGNNDFPFLRPDLHLVVTDALRPDQLDSHHPGEAVLRMADLVIVNKVDAAGSAQVARLEAGLDALVPGVPRVRARSPVVLDDPGAVTGRRVLVVDDGPTLTHGGMPYGAGFVALYDMPGVIVVDPRRAAPARLQALYAAYPHLGAVLPAVGYDANQRDDLRAAINGSDAEVVVTGTPIDLARVLDLDKPVVRARYSYADGDGPTLWDHVTRFADARGLG